MSLLLLLKPWPIQDLSADVFGDAVPRRKRKKKKLNMREEIFRNMHPLPIPIVKIRNVFDDDEDNVILLMLM